ncbi:hypothetical protein PPYR_01830 [Photinus pyralis]|uniref:Peptidase A2 domain-containing protein n=1 Tax=Photinus pyralis TaxID=7054 RepID=A0A1Y1KD80_PHOPY|nr:hypothetical protein PPYR_01830 [Photinus pyralis]
MTTHFSRDCPMERRERCRRCGAADHVWADCVKRREPPQVASKAVPKAISKVSLLLKTTDTFFKVAFVKGCPVNAYIDSGSEQSIVTLATARRLALSKKGLGIGVVLKGFGGGQAVALGEAWFTAKVDDIELDIRALVTDVDMGAVELLLGQSALSAPGITMVVRQGKALLTDEGDIEAFLGRLTLAESEPERYEVRLVADLICPPRSHTVAIVKVMGGMAGGKVRVNERRVCTKAHNYVIDRCFIEADKFDMVPVMNYGETFINWKNGHLLARAETYLEDEHIQNGRVLREKPQGGR